MEKSEEKWRSAQQQEPFYKVHFLDKPARFCQLSARLLRLPIVVARSGSAANDQSVGRTAKVLKDSLQNDHALDLQARVHGTGPASQGTRLGTTDDHAGSI